MNKLEALLAQPTPILLDGAMGTMLFAAGLATGNAPEVWNMREPQKIQAIHQAYVDAGSQIFLTNTFGGTRYRLKLHDMQNQVVEINKAAAEIGRRVADAAQQTVLVGGSIGPSGELLSPLGEMEWEQARDAFAEQAEGLAAGGADLLWIETMSDVDEVLAAIAGAQQVCDLPICATLSFDTRGRTMMGISGRDVVARLADSGIVAMGANCGNNLPETLYAISEMQAANVSLPLIVKANAGMPVWQGKDLVYNGSPEVMGAFAHKAAEMGVRLIGGCCGTSDEHIRRMGQVLRGEIAPPDVDIAVTVLEGDSTAALSEHRPKRTRKHRRRRT